MLLSVFKNNVFKRQKLIWVYQRKEIIPTWRNKWIAELKYTRKSLSWWAIQMKNWFGNWMFFRCFYMPQVCQGSVISLFYQKDSIVKKQNKAAATTKTTKLSHFNKMDEMVSFVLKNIHFSFDCFYDILIYPGFSCLPAIWSLAWSWRLDNWS